jgi:putative DNA primase/helicase
VQPASSAEAIGELEDLGSPIGAFIRDRCQVQQGRRIQTKTLYAAWRTWCESEGRDHPDTLQSFARDLRAAVPGLRVDQRRLDGDRVRYFEGIDLGGE